MSHEPLKEAREAQGITLPRMAEIIGMDKGNLSRVERGKASAQTVERVANRYEIALNAEPRSLVRKCGTLPATLLELVKPATPGYRSRLSTIRAICSLPAAIPALSATAA